MERSGICRLTERDIQPAIALVWRVFEEFEAPEYSAEGIQNFRNYLGYGDAPQLVFTPDNTIWGWFEDGALVGLIALKGDDHITLLFVDRSYHRRGIATALMERLTAEAKARGARRVTVHSSPYAVEVYHRLGFRDTGPEQVRDGLRFTPMERMLR